MALRLPRATFRRALFQVLGLGAIILVAGSSFPFGTVKSDVAFLHSSCSGGPLGLCSDPRARAAAATTTTAAAVAANPRTELAGCRGRLGTTGRGYWYGGTPSRGTRASSRRGAEGACRAVSVLLHDEPVSRSIETSYNPSNHIISYDTCSSTSSIMHTRSSSPEAHSQQQHAAGRRILSLVPVQQYLYQKVVNIGAGGGRVSRRTSGRREDAIHVYLSAVYEMRQQQEGSLSLSVLRRHLVRASTSFSINIWYILASRNSNGFESYNLAATMGRERREKEIRHGIIYCCKYFVRALNPELPGATLVFPRDFLWARRYFFQQQFKAKLYSV